MFICTFFLYMGGMERVKLHNLWHFTYSLTLQLWLVKSQSNSFLHTNLIYGVVFATIINFLKLKKNSFLS